MSTHRPYAVLATCCLSLFVVTMDVSIVNVALPAIRRDLHASVAGLQWSVDGYTIVVASCLVLSGSLADRFGRRRIFRLGLAVFTLGSLLCSLAATTNALVAFRMVQALGGSMLNPVAMSIVVNAFPDARDRARAIGVWGAVFGVSMAIGPVLGGALLEGLGWRSIFWVNVPIGAVALALTARVIPESRATSPRRFDFVAQVLLVGSLFALTSAVVDGPRLGWACWQVATRLGAALGAVVAFVAWESRSADPLLERRAFRQVTFSSSCVLALLSFTSFGALLFSTSLYLQEARGLHATTAGLVTMPIALALMICSPLSGRLVGAGQIRLAIVLAGTAIACGALLLAHLANDTPLVIILSANALFGVGLGCVGAPIHTMALGGMPSAHAGVAAAVASTSRQLGASLGVALAGALLGDALEAGRHAEIAASSHVMFWSLAACGVAIVIVGLVATRARALGAVGLARGGAQPSFVCRCSSVSSSSEKAR